jgi:hypothetical protein
MNIIDKRTFGKFGLLAPELRLKIWLYALPEPTVVEIEWCGRFKFWYCPKESQSTTCGLLGATTESRVVFLKHYHPLVTKEASAQGQGTCHHDSTKGTIVYIDPTIDILYIGASSENETCVSTVSLETLKTTESLSDINVLACELREWIDGSIEDDENLYSWFPSSANLILTWGDVTHEEFERNITRPEGEIRLRELSLSEKDTQAVKGVVKWYEEATRNFQNIEGTKACRIPEMMLMRLSRGEALMDYNVEV